MSWHNMTLQPARIQALSAVVKLTFWWNRWCQTWPRRWTTTPTSPKTPSRSKPSLTFSTRRASSREAATTPLSSTFTWTWLVSWFTYGRGGSSIGSTSDYGSRGPSGSLAFFYSSLSYPSICGVSLNSSHMEIQYYRFSTFQQINWRQLDAKPSMSETWILVSRNWFRRIFLRQQFLRNDYAKDFAWWAKFRRNKLC